MRRICALLVAVVLSQGCGENSVSVQTQAARADFIKAVELVNLVQLVHSPSTDRLKSIERQQAFGLDGLSADAVTALTSAKGYDEYRAAVFAAAEGRLKAVLDKGQTSQRVAARQLLAQIHTLVTAAERRKALVGSDRLSDEASILVTSVMNMQRAHALSIRYSKDDAELVAQLTEDQGAAEKRATDLGALVTKLSGELATLEAQIATSEKARDAAFKKASTLRAQAFTKKGQEGYDLHIAAIEADREGFAAEARKGEASAARDQIKTPAAGEAPAFGTLPMAEHDLKIAGDWQKLIMSTLGAAGTRKASMGTFEQSMNKSVADTLARQFLPAFQEVERTFKELIEAPIESALKRIDDAINISNTAVTMAPPEKKVDANMSLADVNVEKLCILADGVVSTARVGNVLETVLARGEEALGQNAAGIKALLEAVTARNTTYHAEAFKIIAAIKAQTTNGSLATPGEPNVLIEAQAARITSINSLVAMQEAKLNGHKLARTP